MMTSTLERDLRTLYGAYAYLRTHDLSAVSTTARLLRQGDLALLAGRVRDELEELRGAVAGTHGHGGGRDDVVLEAYQSLYWLIVLAVAAGDDYETLRPHEVLAMPVSAGAATRAAWIEPVPDALRDAARRRQALRDGLTCLASQCHEAGVEVAEAVRRDLRELHAKPYLEPFWKDMKAGAHDRDDA